MTVPSLAEISASIRAWARRLKRDGLTLWFAARHADTPWYAKALAMFVVGYALSPIDLIPDFIPVLGYLDDVLLLPALIWLTIRLLPLPVLAA
ncbi:MAG: YkvA family protein, partial [Rubrivivax sp.]